MFFFFFKQKTAYEMRISDWSSDVCSSDLRCRAPGPRASAIGAPAGVGRRGRESGRCAWTGAASARVRRCRRWRRCGGRRRPAIRVARVDRKGVGEGKRVAGRVDIGGSRVIKKKKKL